MIFLEQWFLREPFAFQDTMEFIRSFQSEAPLKRGAVSAQDASLQDRVLAQVRLQGPRAQEAGGSALA